MTRPIIGLTLDAEPAGGYSKQPWYAIRENYCDAVVAAGGAPIALPHEPDLAADYLAMLDGLIVTGGNFDVDPVLFGAGERHGTVTTKDRRTAFELAITRAAHAQDMPSLGICGGQQLMNVAFGGTLIQHIPDSVPNALAHEQPNPRTEPGHGVTLAEQSTLIEVVGSAEMQVNSAHHQAVDAAAPGFLINARAPDGVIEGIEDPAKRWFIGVQWHPEYSIDQGDPKILAALIDACRP